MTTTKDEQRPAPATDEDVQGLMGAIHQHHNLFGGECSHCAPIVASIRARIDQQRETIAALQARADKAEVDLRDHKTALNTLTDLYEEKAEELIKARAEVERLYGKVQGHGLVLAERDALRAQLAAADENLKTMLQAAGEEAERQLAAAREEIAKLREACTVPDVTFNAERRARERAEARVKELEETLFEIEQRCDHQIPPYAYADNGAACEFANRLRDIAILAARAREGEQR